MIKKKILIVDDAPVICALLKKRLEANGYDVVIALQGKEALDKVKLEKPDLILLDIAMPDIDGFELGARLKADKESSNTPIIIVSACADYDSVVKAMTELKVAGYIVKPFTPQDLLDQIKKALSGQDQPNI